MNKVMDPRSSRGSRGGSTPNPVALAPLPEAPAQAGVHHTLIKLRKQQRSGPLTYMAAQHGIDMLKCSVDPSYTPQPIYRTALHAAFWMPLMVWQLSFLAFLLFGIWRVKEWCARRRFISIALFVFALMGGSCLLYQRYQAQYQRQVIAPAVLELRSGPGASYAHIATVAQMSEGVVLDRYNFGDNRIFYKVKMGQQRGWVTGDDVEVW